ncbi:hypothetical protein SAMN05421740_103182 [Parapedobacter koreensis]|uniref:Uncharacterized protein n=1 Tax=Parapedobacter koreensis TaxID=332977 RepID=A0A1H7LJ25_9SPHI|nr:hypothetical protein SAMN05421740_103182 [Parapedobacter koreensis]
MIFIAFQIPSVNKDGGIGWNAKDLEKEYFY